ncbi:11545_t:CDS:2, partial [Ambispora gerdemannii]
NSSFTIDLWTQFHIPYIGVTIHWLTSDFELRQGLLTIEKFPYGHSGISDNATNMTAALQQFNYQHINCYAHTLQLAINEVRNDGNNLEILLLDDNEWSALQDLLKPFVQITDIIGGSQYPTLSIMCPVVIKLKSHLVDFKSHTNQIIKIRDPIKQQIVMCWQDILLMGGFFCTKRNATMLQIPTLSLNDPLYLTENPLILWKLHHKALPIHPSP